MSSGLSHVSVTDDAGCLVIDSFFVDLLPQPTADFEIDSIIELNTPIRLTNNSYDEISWYWDFGNQTYSTIEQPTLIYDVEGNFIVNLEVLNEHGCSDTISKNILVLNDLVLFVPNTFTPNGDFKNDFFQVSALNYQIFELNVYNSYGNLLFSTTDPNIGWDGTYKGSLVQMGSYVVKIFAVDIFGKVYNESKNILLLN